MKLLCFDTNNEIEAFGKKQFLVSFCNINIESSKIVVIKYK